jgi:hypothetical protein
MTAKQMAANTRSDRFFSSVTSYFKAKYEGRYFAVTLKELARTEPEVFLQIIKKAGLSFTEAHVDALLERELTIDLEWWFPDKSRRADLAVYLEKDDPILLAEVKVEDGLRARQLDDYISYVKKSTARSDRRTKRYKNFLFLSRYPPRLTDSKLLQLAIKNGMPVGELRHGQLHQIMSGYGGAVTRMLLEYLEDKGMTYQKIDLRKKDRAAVIHMGSSVLGMRMKGLGRYRSKSSIDLVPNLMERLFGNIEVLGTSVYFNNRQIFGNRFRRDFSVYRECDLPKKVRARVFSDKRKTTTTEDEKTDDVLESLSVVGGQLLFYAYGSFICPKGKWADLSIGIYMELGKKNSYWLAAEFEWRGGLGVAWEKRASYEVFSKFPEESAAQLMLWRVLKNAKAKTMRLAPPPYRAIFKRLVVR